MLAHSVHFALVAAGLAGLGALLAPTVSLRQRPGAPPRRARDAHDARVGALRAAVAQYAEDGAAQSLLPGADRAVLLASAGSTLLVPLAVTGSLGAAGVHLAVAPEHLREGLVPGAFLLACAVAQLLWAGRASRLPTPGWLLAGAIGNLGVLAVWCASRTVGLPLGVPPGPEAVGTWDLACASFEVVVVAACLTALHRGVRRSAPWREWHPGGHAWAATVVTLLVALAAGGGGH